MVRHAPEEMDMVPKNTAAAAAVGITDEALKVAGCVLNELGGCGFLDSNGEVIFSGESRDPVLFVRVFVDLEKLGDDRFSSVVIECVSMADYRLRYEKGEGFTALEWVESGQEEEESEAGDPFEGFFVEGD